MLITTMGWWFATVIGLLLCGAHQTQAHCNTRAMYHTTHDIYVDTVYSCIGDFAIQIPIVLLKPTRRIVVQLTKMNNIEATISNLHIYISGTVTIKEVVFTDSNITAFPSALLAFEQLEYLEVSGNNIESINLNILPYAKQLVTLNVSHNGIQEFETDSTTYLSTKHLKRIDLSYNELVRIPNDLFHGTRDSLLYLDLSHNQISTFDYYAFSSLVLLEEIRLSHNKIVNFGLIFYPMRNLRNLFLDHNLITEINSQVFDKSTSLAALDLSYNNIEEIEDQSFSSLKALIDLDLTGNNITSIKEILFRKNTRLSFVGLSFNKLSFIEPRTFSSIMNLNAIGLEGAFATEIQEQVFADVEVSELNLAGSKIHKISGRPFISMKYKLRSLNLSSSEIKEISETALDKLAELRILDLSQNQLSEIAFRTVDLKNLIYLNLRNNLIRELEPKHFEHLISLQELDLSNNDIQTIPAMTLKNLKNVVKFNMNHNKLGSTMVSKTFYGLEKVEELILTNTNIQKWDSYALSGLKSLKVLNASHGQLTYIDYDAFNETGRLEILDLSNNKLQNFNVHLLPNLNLKEIYINNNKISSFSEKTFEGLQYLVTINLSNNNLTTIETPSFKTLKSLTFLDLSYNNDLELDGKVFENLKQLHTVLLKNVSNKITFESENVTIQNLDLSSSRISNVSLLQLHCLKKLVKLDLSYNNLTILDQFSFDDLTSLPSFTWLNLGHNNLEFINPGTFLKVNSLIYLDLSHNFLETIQFGALSGLKKMHSLNLSNNILLTFKITILRDMPAVSIVILDNNRISYIDVRRRDYKYNLNQLSIGGNYLTCDNLIDLTVHSDVITAQAPNYFTENVNGIPCTSYHEPEVEQTPTYF